MQAEWSAFTVQYKEKQLTVFGWVLSVLCFPQKSACWPLNWTLKGLQLFFFVCLFFCTSNKSRLRCTFVLCIPLNPAQSPARCIRLNSVRIDPSELYYIMLSYCLLCAFRLLWGLCMWLLSAIHWFPLASWFNLSLWLFSCADVPCTLTALIMVVIWFETSSWHWIVELKQH